jgi:membrane protease YdiL (CAAX protease family)
VSEDRARYRRESVTWLVLAIAGTLIQLRFGFISGGHFAPGIVARGSIEFVVVTIVLTAMIPFAVKINHQLGLPGGPLITAKINGDERPNRWGRVFRDGVLWSVIGASALIVGRVLFVACFLSPTLPAHEIHSAPVVISSLGWLAFSTVIVAIAASVREEILFRFVLMGIFSWALVIFRNKVDWQPTRSQLWLATIMQGYCFGLVHLVLGSYLARGIIGVSGFATHTLILPQTWIGILFGRLYLKSGLEASIVAHIVWSLTAGLLGVLFEAVVRRSI